MQVKTIAKAVVGGAMLLITAACNNTDTISRNKLIGGHGGTRALLTTADLRLVTDRPAPDGTRRRIVCAEPQPDVAKALSASAAASIAVTTQASVGGNASAGYASAEQLAALAGRVPALLALRDGLFRACEAYANGIIGDASYALLLSRYGEILVTVVLADAASSGSASTLATLTGLNLVQPATGSNTATPSKSTAPAASPAAGSKADAASALPSAVPAEFKSGVRPASLPIPVAPIKPPSLVHLAKLEDPRTVADVQGAPAVHGGTESPPAPSGGAEKNDFTVTIKVPSEVTLPAGSSLTCSSTAAAGQNTTYNCSVTEVKAKPAPAAPAAPKATPAADASKPAATPTVAIPAQSIQLMQQSYLGLSVTGPLLVACISEFDPTRPGAREIPAGYRPPEAVQAVGYGPGQSDQVAGQQAAAPTQRAVNRLLQENCGGFMQVLTDRVKSAGENDDKVRLLNAQAALTAAQKAK